MQMISELAGSILCVALVNWAAESGRAWGFPSSAAGVGVWIYIQLYLKYRIYPPIPFSVRAIYGTVSGCGIFMWVSRLGRRVAGVQAADSQRDGWDQRLSQGHAHGGVNRDSLGVGGALPTVRSCPVLEEPIELRTVHRGAAGDHEGARQDLCAGKVVENPYRVNKRWQVRPGVYGCAGSWSRPWGG